MSTDFIKQTQAGYWRWRIKIGLMKVGEQNENQTPEKQKYAWSRHCVHPILLLPFAGLKSRNPAIRLVSIHTFSPRSQVRSRFAEISRSGEIKTPRRLRGQ